MFIAEQNRIALAVGVALSGASSAHPASRLVRAQVIFPDIGKLRVVAVGFLRYDGELSMLKPEATEEERAVPPGLTINL